MSARRWGTGAGGIAAAALCVVLAACGPADGGGAAGLQSVGQAGAGTSTSVAVPTAPSPTAPIPTAARAPALTTKAPATSTAAISSPKPSPPKTTSKPAAPTKAAASVAASVGAGSIRYGDQSAFTVTVKTPKACADLTGHVAVLDGGAVLVEGDTAGTGTVSLGFLNTADPGSKTYTVRYDGNAKVAAAKADVPVTTTRTNVDISIDWTDGLLPGADATITADVIGTPQSPGGKATISVDGTAITDAALSADGLITGTVKAVTAGEHQVEAAYAGDVRFDPTPPPRRWPLTAPPVNPNQAGAAAAQANNHRSSPGSRDWGPGRNLRHGCYADSGPRKAHCATACNWRIQRGRN